MREWRPRESSTFSSTVRWGAAGGTLFRSSAMSWAISSADVCASLMMRARVTNMRPHDATPTVTATLTAMSQILVRIVTEGRQSYLGLMVRGWRHGARGATKAGQLDSVTTVVVGWLPPL